jgi:hypothetical protein
MKKIKVLIKYLYSKKDIKIGSLIFNMDENMYSIINHSLHIDMMNKQKDKYRHIDLYLFSEEKCKLNDWYYEPDTQTCVQVTKDILPLFEKKSPFSFYKIEATTNKDLKLPNIPLWFLNFYAKQGGNIDTVDIAMSITSACECDSFEKSFLCPHSSGENCMKRFSDGEFWHTFPSVDINDCVIITKEKETLTVDEVQHMFDVITMMISEKHNYSNDETNAFINECQDFLKDEINLLK